MRFTQAFLFFFLLVSSSLVLAEIQLEDFQAGIFDSTPVDLEEGQRIQYNNEKIIETRAIPARLGTKFGIRFTLSGKHSAVNLPITYFYLTPGVVHPDKTRHDKYEVYKQLSATAPNHTIAFQFTSDWEIVPGIWRLMVFEGDRLLVGESFAVGVDESLITAPPMQKPVTLKSLIKQPE